MNEPSERRKYTRISKNFTLSYFDKENPSLKYEITQLKNISLGGICFVTTQLFAPKTQIAITLKTPYLTELTDIEANVLESIEKVKNLIYETRMEFNDLSPQAESLIKKLIKFFENEERPHHE